MSWLCALAKAFAKIYRGSQMDRAIIISLHLQPGKIQLFLPSNVCKPLKDAKTITVTSLLRSFAAMSFTQLRTKRLC